MTYCSNLPLPDNWETELEYLLLKSQSDKMRRKVYICSPCRAETKEAVYANMKAARFYMYYVFKHMNMNPRAPHAYVPVLLDDNNEYERVVALLFGKDLILGSKEVLVCGRRLTEGMRGELEKAFELGIPVNVYDSDLYTEISKIYQDNSGLSYHNPSPLALGTGELFEI